VSVIGLSHVVSRRSKLFAKRHVSRVITLILSTIFRAIIQIVHRRQENELLQFDLGEFVVLKNRCLKVNFCRRSQVYRCLFLLQIGSEHLLYSQVKGENKLHIILSRRVTI